MFRACLFVIAIVSCVQATAGIVGTTGAVVIVNPVAPDNDFTTNGAGQSDTVIRTFAEVTDFALPSLFPVNVSIAGTSLPGDANLSSLDLPTGGYVNTYFVHFDPVGRPSQLVNAAGSITFDEIVVGLVFRNGALNTTNAITPFPGVSYPDDGRVELDDPGTFIALSDNLKTVSFAFAANLGSDNIRIVTATAGLRGGDANLNRIVDGADYVVWADNFLQNRRSWTQGDFNGDQFVDGADYTAWADNFAPAALTLAAVPEPSTLALAVVGVASVVLRRRKPPGE